MPHRNTGGAYEIGLPKNMKEHGNSGATLLPTMKCIRCLLCCGLLLSLGLPAYAQWRRTVMSGKGSKTDIPEPHPLAYWITDPFARDDGGDFCIGCRFPDGHIETVNDYTVTTNVHRIGVLAGYPIVEILYNIQSHTDSIPPGIHWKFILIGTGPNQYREIYHLQGYYIAPELKPSRIVNLGNESILATCDSNGGHSCFEEYWWFDAQGPHTVNWVAVEDIASQYTPVGQPIYFTCWALDLDHRTINITGQRPTSQCNGCGEPGKLTIHFVLNKAKAEPTKIDFQPSLNK